MSFLGWVGNEKSFSLIVGPAAAPATSSDFFLPPEVDSNRLRNSSGEVLKIR